MLLEWLTQLLALPVDLLVLVAVERCHATDEVIELLVIINLHLSATFKFELAEVFLLLVEGLLDRLEYYLSLFDLAIRFYSLGCLTSAADRAAARAVRVGRAGVGGQA